MRIWIIDHYSVPIKYYPLARNTNFAKQFKKKGHEVIIFSASTVHNSNINLIEGKEQFKEMMDEGVKYVLVKCHQYSGNGAKRILNMLEFAKKLGRICNQYEKPDVIISTSMTLHACKKGIELGIKYGCQKIAQITDLWPETIVAYGAAKKWHPIVLWFRRIEKWIYKKSDQIVFSMGGAYDYIKQQHWDNIIPINKVHIINNGVDLDLFNYNKEHYKIDDKDLIDSSIFKVIYTGSIRKVNNINLLLDVAKEVKNSRIKFLIWGDGDELSELKNRIDEERILNVVFKGKVEKKYIPYIVSNADLNFAHNSATPLFRYGISFNKIFDYFAAGKPILCDFPSKYNPVIITDSGFDIEDCNSKTIAAKIDFVSNMDIEQYNRYCSNALKAANKYRFDTLANDFQRLLTNPTGDKAIKN